MGTSGAYGGTRGWTPVRRQTQRWLDSGGGTGDSSDDDASSPVGPSPQTEPVISPLPAPVTRLIRELARSLIQPVGGGPRGGSGRGSAGGAGATGGGGRTAARAVSVGGRAAAGVYGLRTGASDALAEVGLSLDELRGLAKHEQARRLLDAAAGPSGAVFESELRLASAAVILWALNEDIDPPPIDLANRWVVEYVWQVWITEDGPKIRAHLAEGYDSFRLEQEMRAALEATVAGHGLPSDRPLTTRDFELAIQSALESLGRIGGTRP